MDRIAWTAEMSVGSETLDEHHRMLINCLNQLGELLKTSADQARLAEVVSALEEFVLVHFSEEEQAMRAAGFPDWRAHKALHDRMYDLVFSLKSDVEHGRAVDAVRLHGLLYDWLMKHILGEDRAYIPFLEHPNPEAASVWRGSHG